MFDHGTSASLLFRLCSALRTLVLAPVRGLHFLFMRLVGVSLLLMEGQSEPRTAVQRGVDATAAEGTGEVAEVAAQENRTESTEVREETEEVEKLGGTPEEPGSDGQELVEHLKRRSEVVALMREQVAMSPRRLRTIINVVHKADPHLHSLISTNREVFVRILAGELEL
eukprot:Hpha_TRINITY_DN2271_c0_g1::TRINITY_DN2271_c0_g1_i1::g.25367::m.25367